MVLQYIRPNFWQSIFEGGNAVNWVYPHFYAHFLWIRHVAKEPLRHEITSQNFP